MVVAYLVGSFNSAVLYGCWNAQMVSNGFVFSWCILGVCFYLSSRNCVKVGAVKWLLIG